MRLWSVWRHVCHLMLLCLLLHWLIIPKTPPETSKEYRTEVALSIFQKRFEQRRTYVCGCVCGWGWGSHINLLLCHAPLPKTYIVGVTGCINGFTNHYEILPVHYTEIFEGVKAENFFEKQIQIVYILFFFLKT